MSFNSLLIHSIAVMSWSASTADRYNNPTSVFTSSGTYAARVEQINTAGRRSQEILAGRDTTLTWFEIFVGPSVSVKARDRIVWGSRTLEVDGAPVLRYNSTSLHHIEIIAKEISD
jgi:head-tail adaptor